MLAEIPSGTVEEKWNAFKSIMSKVFKEKLVTAVRKPWERLNGNGMEQEELINNRNLARNNMLRKNTKSTKVRYRKCCQLLRQRRRELKNKWWLIKAAKLQIVAEFNEPKAFYQNMKAAWEPRVNHPEQLLALENKTIITEKHMLLAKWKDHFASLLNELSTVEKYAGGNIEQKPAQHWTKATGCVKAKTWMKCVRLSLCSATDTT